MMKSILGSGGACAVSDQSVTYVGPCFVRNRNVDVQMGKILTDGYQSTASYLYAVFKWPTPVAGGKPGTLTKYQALVRGK